MDLIKRLTALTGGLLWAFGALSQCRAAEGEEFMRLYPAVQERAISVLKDYKPQITSLKLAEVQEIDNVGNFGRIVQVEQQTAYSKQDSGLWAVVGVGGLTSGAAAGVGQTLSLCGLVSLLMVTNSTTKLDTTTAIPFGRLFVPFGIRSSIDVGRRVRVKDFKTDYGEVCSPAPSAKFTYQIENEFQVKTSGMLGRTVTGSVVVDVSCQVSDNPASASQLSPSFRGEYLTVTCESTARSGQKGKVVYAFLREAGLYLTLSEAGSAQTTKVRYKSVEYEE